MASKREKLTKRDIIRHVKRIIALVIIVIAVMLFVIVWKVFTIEKVSVTGNVLYSAQEVQKSVLTGRFSWNSLIMYLKYRTKQPDNMPYADQVTVSLSDPHTLKIYVSEKEKIGYAYLPEQKQYGYLDKNGMVLRLVKKPLEDTIHLIGIQFSGGELYKKVELEDKSILSELLRAVRLLEKYGILPETIYVQNSNAIYLVYGKIYVNIGSTNLLNEKLVRVNSILPKLKEEKLKGVLHLETWTESTTDIYFRKKESVKIPSDEEASAAKSSEKSSEDSKKSSEDSKKNAKSPESPDGKADSSDKKEKSSDESDKTGDASGETDQTGDSSDETDSTEDASGETDQTGDSPDETDGTEDASDEADKKEDSSDASDKKEDASDV